MEPSNISDLVYDGEVVTEAEEAAKRKRDMIAQVHFSWNLLLKYRKIKEYEINEANNNLIYFEFLSL